MNTIKKIGIVCALEKEAEPIIQRLGLKLRPYPDTDLPSAIYSGIYHGVEVTLSLAGQDSRYLADNIGTNAAVLSTYLLIERFKPDLILNPGTAGAFRTKGAAIGDLYLGQQDVRFHDRRTPVEKYREYCVGFYPVVPAPRLISALGLKSGIVSSGNSFDCADVDRRRMEEIKSELKDMEAAAIGWVAWVKRTPFLPLKAVTDFVEDAEKAEAQFIANWQACCAALGEGVARIVAFVAGKAIGEL